MLDKLPWNKHAEAIDYEIKTLLDTMSMEGPHSENYPVMLGYVKQLMELKTKKRRMSVSWDTIAVVAGNLLGISMLIRAEKEHMISRTGLQQLIRPKLGQ